MITPTLNQLLLSGGQELMVKAGAFHFVNYKCYISRSAIGSQTILEENRELSSFMNKSANLNKEKIHQSVC